MTTKTYTELLDMIKSLCGVEFATVELGRINALVNRRAKRAYRASNNWPRFINVGEPRSGAGRIVQYNAAPVVATALVVGVQYTITVVGTTVWTTVGATSSTVGEKFICTAAGTGTGTATPNVIGTFLKIQAVAPYTTASPQDYNFYVDNLGARLITSASISSNVFVTYKEVLDETYGETTGLQINVPSEWFDYIAHGVYADYLRAEGQQEKSQLADSEASMILEDELIQVDQQGAGMTFGSRFLANANGNVTANAALRKSQG
jgi:hypothetical protein